MNLDEIEDLIRRYLSAGITVVIILVAPATGGTDEELAPGGEPSVITVDPDRTEPDDTTDPRVRDVPDEDDTSDPAPADDPADDDTPTRDDPTDTDPTDPDPTDPDPTDPDSTDTNTDPTNTDPTDPTDPTDTASTDTASTDADPDPTRDDPDPDPDDPAVDGEDVRDDGTDDSSILDERPSEDVEPSDEDTDERPADQDPTDERPADQDPTDQDPTDEYAADPDASDAQTDDPDLDSRGPADGSEPGIDDEQAAAPGDDDTAPDTRESADPEPGSATEGTTAAERYGWGTPDREDDFGSGLAQWDLYDGPGHAGEGQRSPDAVTVQDGVLTITGDADGTTGGMTWTPGQQYGRWEGRVRAPASDPSYNALLLLWSDAEDFPEGGEIDFMEMLDPTRQTTEFFLHHGPDNDQVTAQVEIDGTEWHNWAVEWTPDEIVGYVDGEEWFRTTDTATFPPGPMHLCIQLDWFPDGAAEVQESTMEVDWVRQYALDPAGEAPPRETVSTEPASVVEPTGSGDDPLLRMFSWS